MKLIRRALKFFLNTKSRIDRRHSYALAVLQDSALWVGFLCNTKKYRKTFIQKEKYAIYTTLKNFYLKKYLHLYYFFLVQIFILCSKQINYLLSDNSWKSHVLKSLFNSLFFYCGIMSPFKCWLMNYLLWVSIVRKCVYIQK